MAQDLLLVNPRRKRRCRKTIRFTIARRRLAALKGWRRRRAHGCVRKPRSKRCRALGHRVKRRGRR